MRIPNRPGGTQNKLAGPAERHALSDPHEAGSDCVRASQQRRPRLAVPTSASASTVTSPVVGYTYVDGNTAPANTIDGFARHADGSLTPLAGSPFSAWRGPGARGWPPRARSR